MIFEVLPKNLIFIYIEMIVLETMLSHFSNKIMWYHFSSLLNRSQNIRLLREGVIQKKVRNFTHLLSQKKNLSFEKVKIVFIKSQRQGLQLLQVMKVMQSLQSMWFIQSKSSVVICCHLLSSVVICCHLLSAIVLTSL